MAGPLARLLALTAAALFLLAAMPAALPRPDVVMLLLAPTALRGGRQAGAWYGFCGGLVLGLVGPGSPGLFAGVYGLAGLLLGSLGEEGGTDSMFMQFLAIVIGTVTVGLLLAAAGSAAPGLGGPSVPVLRGWLPATLAANLLVAWPARGLFRLAAGQRAFRRWGLEL